MKIVQTLPCQRRPEIMPTAPRRRCAAVVEAPNVDAKDLAAQLPSQLRDVLLTAPPPVTSLGVEQFLARVAAVLGTSPETARWDASAVLSTVADAVSDGELTDVLSQLPRGFPELFGRPQLD